MFNSTLGGFLPADPLSEQARRTLEAQQEAFKPGTAPGHQRARTFKSNFNLTRDTAGTYEKAESMASSPRHSTQAPSSKEKQPVASRRSHKVQLVQSLDPKNRKSIE